MTNELKPAIVTGMNWPPTASDSARLDAYAKYRQIVDGDHVNALGDRDELDRYGIYVTCNLAGLIVRRATDLLFGEELSFQWEDDAPEEKIESVENWWYDNDLQRILYEGALDGASMGDAVYLPYRDSEGVVGVMPGQVQTWFPELDPDDVRKVYRHIFAWEREWKDQQGKSYTFLKVKIHNKGFVENQLWELKGGKVGTQHFKGDPVWQALWGDALEKEDGIDGEFLVVHVPNYRAARDYFGYSDVKGLDPLFSALNARYSQMDHLFANHADPIIRNLPKGIADPITGELNKKDLDYIEASGDPDEKDPDYMTWNSDSAAMLQFIDELTNKILLLSETDKALLGLDTGGGPASGRAIKFALMATLAKVNRKRAYYSKAIPKIIELAQMLWGEKQPVYPTILWPDGLPQDTLELLEEVDRRLANGTLSKKDAVKRLDDVDNAIAQNMLDEISEEEDNSAESISRTVLGKPKPKIEMPVITEETL